MKPIHLYLGIAALILGLTSCDEKHAPDDGHPHAPEPAESHDHASAGEGASYEEGKGITLSKETEESLGLELTEVEEKPIGSRHKLTAQVYRSATEASRKHGPERQGRAYATALIAKEVASQIRVGQKLTILSKEGPREGTIWKIDLAQVPIIGKAEALLEVTDSGSLAVGDFIEAELPIGPAGQKVVSIPLAAVLETSTGKFAFVRNGSCLLRTGIKTGAQDRDHIEVTDGLYEGDTIAVKPVEALYLIELRATKGGGHCH